MEWSQKLTSCRNKKAAVLQPMRRRVTCSTRCLHACALQDCRKQYIVLRRDRDRILLLRRVCVMLCTRMSCHLQMAFKSTFESSLVLSQEMREERRVCKFHTQYA